MICRRENDFVSSAGHSGHKVSLLKKFSTEKPRRKKERRMKKFKKDIILFLRAAVNPHTGIIIRKTLCLHIGNQRSQGFSLAFGRHFQLAVFQKRCYAMQKEPAVGVENKLQFIFFYLFEMGGN